MKELTIENRNELVTAALYYKTGQNLSDMPDVDLEMADTLWDGEGEVRPVVRLETSLDGDETVNKQLVIKAAISVLARMSVVMDKTWKDTGVDRAMDFLEGAYVSNGGNRSLFHIHTMLVCANKLTKQCIHVDQLERLAGLIVETEYLEIGDMVDLIEQLSDATNYDFDKVAADWM